MRVALAASQVNDLRVAGVSGSGHSKTEIERLHSVFSGRSFKQSTTARSDRRACTQQSSQSQRRRVGLMHLRCPVRRVGAWTSCATCPLVLSIFEAGLADR